MTIADAVASLPFMGAPVDEDVVEAVWEHYERWNPPEDRSPTVV